MTVTLLVMTLNEVEGMKAIMPQSTKGLGRPDNCCGWGVQ